MYQLKHLSHNYSNINGLRMWRTKCVAFASMLSASNECFSTSGVVKPPKLGPKSLRNFNYRYIVVWLRGKPTQNMYIKTVNASQGYDTDQRRLVGGVDFRLVSALQSRFGCDLKTVNSYAQFNRDSLDPANPYGMLANNLGDQICAGQLPDKRTYSVATYVVPNFYDLKMGYDFYTALPLEFPAWEVK